MMRIILFMAVICTFVIGVRAQTTAFTYQGSMQNGGTPANGNYDFEFKLFDLLSAGTQQGSTIQRLNVAVANGIFAVSLDFGAGTLPGADRFLDIAVRTAGGGSFTALTPRQKVNSTPYAVKSLNAATADSVSSATGIPAGSGNYIQNQNAAPQPSSSFSISGDGTAGGTLSGNIIRAATQFNIGATRILSTPGASNLFVGSQSGTNNTTGGGNAFFGDNTGFQNLTGSGNSIFGSSAGIQNTLGNQNSFFGNFAGSSNTSGSRNAFFGARSGESHVSGNENTFVGNSAGFSTTTGSNNVFIGYSAAFSSVTGSNLTIIGSNAVAIPNNLNFATALGAGSLVTTDNTLVLGRAADTVQIPGNFSISGTATGNGSGLTNLNASAITTGTLNPLRLGNGAILNGTTQQASSNFNISGTGTANVFNAGTQFNIAGGRVLSIPGTGNLFAGLGAGGNNTTGTANSFFGNSAGAGITTGSSNTAIGSGTTFLSGNLSNATAIGSLAAVGGSNSLVLGSIDGVNGATQDAKVGIGTTTPLTKFHMYGGGALFEDGNTILRGTGDSSLYQLEFQRSRGTREAPTPILTNDPILRIIARGYNGTNHVGFTGMSIQAAEDFTATNAGSVIRFNVTPLGATNSSTVGAVITATGMSIRRNVEPEVPHKLAVGGGTNLNVSSADVAIFGDGGAYTTVQDNTAQVQALVGADGSSAGGVNGAAIYGSMTPHGILFRTNNSNRMTITDPDGFVGIGTTLPADRLHVNGIIRVITLGAAGSTSLCRNASNQISTCSSSLRYKTNVGQFSDGISFVNRLRPITFDWKDGGIKDVGFGAEDIAKIDPRFVTYNDKGEVEGVKYDRIGVVLVNAVKEQQAQIEQQRNLIETQQRQIDAMKKLICMTNRDADPCKE